jgi:leucyl-tRNA synthetase
VDNTLALVRQALVEDLAGLKGWPEQVKLMQQHWIGKSKGAYLEFPVQRESSATQAKTEPLKIFTTRLDTLLGVTYVVLAPQHPLVQEIAKVLRPLVSCVAFDSLAD